MAIGIVTKGRGISMSYIEAVAILGLSLVGAYVVVKKSIDDLKNKNGLPR